MTRTKCTNCGQELEIDKPGLYSCPTCNKTFTSVTNTSVPDKNQELKVLITLIIIPTLIFGLFWYFNNRWSLMMCSSNQNNYECYDVTFTMHNEYLNKNSCLEVGESLLKSSKSYKGFECGKGCKYTGNLWICEKICSRNGICRD